MEIEPPQVDPELYEQIKASHGAALDAATQVEDKLERQDATKEVEEAVLEQYAGEDADPERRAAVQRAFDKLEKDIIRRRIAVEKRRPGRPRSGRDPRDLDRGRRCAAHARLGHLHPRPDAGVLGRDARHGA